MPTHKKAHDKDKYYHLAKDQGYRSRAAYKLIQINKRFDFLTKARVCIDLCAAPGGWCQVAANIMPQGSIVLGVDLLPIRGLKNVKTFVADITTAECRKLVTQELHGWKADVVLCDGAPNIGSAYTKDAYVQNELVLAALKTATDHLTEGGTFCTKVYRSKDYNALVWVLQQFFVDVQAIKPNSSRSQSAEIFLVGMKYLNPSTIDPKILDPNHVFKELGSDPDAPKQVDVLHKKYDLHNKRHRSGYDDVEGDVLLSKSCSVTDFVKSKDAVRLLTEKNSFTFTAGCKELYYSHPATTDEVQLCFQDLRVLGRLDFKKLLKWRLLMVKATEKEAEEVVAEEVKPREKKNVAALTEEEIQAEIQEQRMKMAQEARKDKKKSRTLLAKERQRQQLGMNSDSFGVDEDMELFTLSESGAKRHSELEGIQEVDLEELEDDFDRDGDSDDEVDTGLIELDDETLEDELETAYISYANRTRAKGDANRKQSREDEIFEKSLDRTTRRALKRARSEEVVKEKTKEDKELETKGEVDAYARMLSGVTEEDEVSSSDDGEDDKEVESDQSSVEEEDEEKEPRNKRKGDTDSQIATRDEQSLLTKANKWFNHPLFKETVVESATQKKKSKEFVPPKLSPEEEEAAARKGLVEMQIPLTDKEKRKLQRKKDTDRKIRRDEKKRTNLGDDELETFSTHVDIAPQSTGLDFTKTGGVDDDVAVDPEVARVRDMIRRGMGKLPSGSSGNSDNSSTFQITPVEEEGFGPLSKVDDRTYDSDEEDYDTYDKTMTLALGTMMLRGSRKKAMVDASYNRFAWNDPNDLPSWFQDDEMKHNKPQLPVPNALMDQIKSKFQKTGTKEIKKVAEARMRKRKRAETKLKAAKKTAKTAAENPDLSDKMKVRAIQKAMKGTRSDKPSKVYVVNRKSGSTRGEGKGSVKFVDKCMKNDIRAAKNKEKKKKKYGGKKK